MCDDEINTEKEKVPDYEQLLIQIMTQGDSPLLTNILDFSGLSKIVKQMGQVQAA